MELTAKSSSTPSMIAISYTVNGLTETNLRSGCRPYTFDEMASSLDVLTLLLIFALK